MNPVQIREKYLELKRDLEMKKLEFDAIHNSLLALQTRCPHPGMKVEDEDYCPDCGYLKK